MNVKEFGLKDMTILPPSNPLACKECACVHDPQMPHNQQSLYYQYTFRQLHGRWPTWADAMAHCTNEMKQAWVAALAERGISIK